MGLDVSLYKFNNFDEYHNTKISYKEAEERLIGDLYFELEAERHEELTEKQKEDLHIQLKDLQKSYEVDYSGDPLSSSHVSVLEPSSNYPDHLFDVGYWRSSYNRAGFNAVTRNLFGKSLYDIIEEAENEQYFIQPDWEVALENAQSFLEEFQQRVEEVGDLKVQELSYNDFKDLGTEEVTNPNTALEVFLQEQKGLPRGGVGYQNRNGHFYPEGIEVFGFVEGKASRSFQGEKPATYVIYKPKFEGEDEGTYDWYLKATEIVIETIEYVLKQEDPEQYVLGWSG